MSPLLGSLTAVFLAGTLLKAEMVSNPALQKAAASWQFSLADLLFVLLVVCMALASAVAFATLMHQMAERFVRPAAMLGHAASVAYAGKRLVIVRAASMLRLRPPRADLPAIEITVLSQ